MTPATTEVRTATATTTTTPAASAAPEAPADLAPARR